MSHPCPTQDQERIAVQLYAQVKRGAPPGTRTPNPRIKSRSRGFVAVTNESHPGQVIGEHQWGRALSVAVVTSSRIRLCPAGLRPARPDRTLPKLTSTVGAPQVH